MAPGRNMSRIYLGIDRRTGNERVHVASRGLRRRLTTSTPVVVLDTSMGNITIELDKEKAPITAENFLKYVDSGFYDNLIFHRVISSFMIQGGGFDEKLSEKTEGQRGTIKNESGNGLSNVRGTIAMARTTDPNSAQNQFFINVEDNKRLDNYRRRLRRLRQGDRRHGRGRQDRKVKTATRRRRMAGRWMTCRSNR